MNYELKIKETRVSSAEQLDTRNSLQILLYKYYITRYLNQCCFSATITFLFNFSLVLNFKTNFSQYQFQYFLITRVQCLPCSTQYPQYTTVSIISSKPVLFKVKVLPHCPCTTSHFQQIDIKKSKIDTVYNCAKQLQFYI